ncbi:MAG TPA: PQQ-binding-like beta-propeller repeat protein [Gemmataceae bacterium]|jgi:outer membrane protein assembly factor BamB
MKHIACLLSAALLTAAAAAADWPVFRGDAAQTGVAADPLPDKLAVRWQFKTAGDANSASVESTAAIAGGVAFVGAFDDHLYALDLATGQMKWKLKTGAIKAPVGVAGGAVFAGNIDGLLYCVDAATGKERWRYNAEAEVTSGINFTADGVLFGTQGETLYCVSRADGRLRWKFDVSGGPVMGTPAVAGGKTFAAGCDSTLHVIDAATGKELAGVPLEGQVGASVAVRGDRLVVGTMTEQVVAVDLKKPEVAWTFHAAKRKQPFFASAALTDKLAITGSRDKRVYALDRATGNEVWSFAADGKVDSSPVVAGARVYVASNDGNLYVLDLATGREVQRVKLDGPISASPAVAGGCLVIGTERGTVYCLGVGK